MNYKKKMENDYNDVIFMNDNDPFQIKHRKRTSKKQLEILEKTFETCIRPDAKLRKKLGDQLGMTPRAVQIWFQNRRAKVKKTSQKSTTKKRIINEDGGNDFKQYYGYYQGYPKYVEDVEKAPQNKMYKDTINTHATQIENIHPAENVYSQYVDDNDVQYNTENMYPMEYGGSYLKNINYNNENLGNENINEYYNEHVNMYCNDQGNEYYPHGEYHNDHHHDYNYHKHHDEHYHSMYIDNNGHYKNMYDSNYDQNNLGYPPQYYDKYYYKEGVYENNNNVYVDNNGYEGNVYDNPIYDNNVSYDNSNEEKGYEEED